MFYNKRKCAIQIIYTTTTSYLARKRFYTVKMMVIFTAKYLFKKLPINNIQNHEITISRMVNVYILYAVFMTKASDIYQCQ